MRAAVVVALLTAVVALLFTFTGCGRDGNSNITAADTAARPGPPPYPLFDDPAGGMIYCSDRYAGNITRMSWDGTQTAALSHGAVVADNFTAADHDGMRIIPYDDTVASWPSEYGDMPAAYRGIPEWAAKCGIPIPLALSRARTSREMKLVEGQGVGPAPRR